MLLERRRAFSTALAAVVVVVVIVGGVGVYVLLSGNPNQPTGTTSFQSSQSSSQTSTQTTTSQGTTPVTSSSTSTTSSPSTSSASTTSESSTSVVSTTSSTSFSSSTSTCTSLTSTTGNELPPVGWGALLGNFSAMEIEYRGSANGMGFNLTSHYEVVDMSMTTFQVNVTQQSDGNLAYFTAWVLKNGTVLAVSYLGQNYTGSQATTFMAFAMAGFIVELLFASPDSLPEFTDSNFVHVVNMTDIMIGLALVHATNYAANSLPIVMSSCEGTTTLDRFALQTGSVTGKTLMLVTALDIKGTIATSSGSDDVDFVLRVTWIS